MGREHGCVHPESAQGTVTCPPSLPHARHPQSQAVSLAHMSEDAQLFSEASGHERFLPGAPPRPLLPLPRACPAWPWSSVHVCLSELSVQGRGLPGAHHWGRQSLPSWLGWRGAGGRLPQAGRGKGGSGLQTWVAPRSPLGTQSRADMWGSGETLAEDWRLGAGPRPR